jgi:hypothetical protein
MRSNIVPTISANVLTIAQQKISNLKTKLGQDVGDFLVEMSTLSFTPSAPNFSAAEFARSLQNLIIKVSGILDMNALLQIRPAAGVISCAMLLANLCNLHGPENNGEGEYTLDKIYQFHLILQSLETISDYLSKKQKIDLAYHQLYFVLNAVNISKVLHAAVHLKKALELITFAQIRLYGIDETYLNKVCKTKLVDSLGIRDVNQYCTLLTDVIKVSIETLVRTSSARRKRNSTMFASVHDNASVILFSTVSDNVQKRTRHVR